MKRFSLFSSSAAMVAALSLAATPAFAAELPVRAAHAGYSAWNADSENVQRDRYRGRRHRGGVDAGDVIGGLLVIGAIAAVASAVSKPSQPRSYPAQYPQRPGDYRGGSRYAGGQGIDGAADMCVREIERNVRVDSVDSVERSGSGWRVSGSLYNGDGFTCQIGPDGRIDDVSFGGRRTYQNSTYQNNNGGEQDRQWTDDRYAAARSNAGRSAPGADYSNNAPAPSAPSANAPAYPGGPVPGENVEDYPEYIPGQDDRYGV